MINQEEYRFNNFEINTYDECDRISVVEINGPIKIANRFKAAFINFIRRNALSKQDERLIKKEVAVEPSIRFDVESKLRESKKIFNNEERNKNINKMLVSRGDYEIITFISSRQKKCYKSSCKQIVMPGEHVVQRRLKDRFLVYCKQCSNDIIEAEKEYNNEDK